MSTIAPETEIIQQDLGDNDIVAHIIKKSDWGNAYIMGEPVRALCGKMWVPHKNPDGRPVCGECAQIFKDFFGKDFT